MKQINNHDGDQFGTYADNSKIKNEGWFPKVNLLNGISEMYSWGMKNE